MLLYLGALLLRVDATGDNSSDQALFGVVLIIILFVGPLATMMVFILRSRDAVASTAYAANRASEYLSSDSKTEAVTLQEDDLYGDFQVANGNSIATQSPLFHVLSYRSDRPSSFGLVPTGDLYNITSNDAGDVEVALLGQPDDTSVGGTLSPCASSWTAVPNASFMT